MKLMVKRLAAAILAIASILSISDSYAGNSEINWKRRVIPLPQKMKVSGKTSVPVSKIFCPELKLNAPDTKLINKLLEPFRLNKSADNCVVELKLKLVSGRSQLSTLPNSDQAYAITSSKKNGKTTIQLTANTATGLLYAARTFTQLVKPPAKTDAKTVIDIPLVNVVDWPDIAERGQWGNYAHISIPWFSKWKLNMIEIGAGAVIDQKGNPILKVDRNLLKQGADYGIKMILYIPHISVIASRTLLPARYRKDLKHLLPAFARNKSGKIVSYPDFTSQVTIRLLKAWVMQMAEVQHKYHNEISIWLSEGEPPKCYTASGKQVNYEMEVEALRQAYEAAKKRFPKIRMRIWLSQGTRRAGKNKVIIDLAKKLGMGIVYYDGGLTYISDKNPMIFPELADFAKNGGFTGVVPQLTNSWRTIAPMTSPQFVHFRTSEFAAKKISAIYGYTVPDRYFYDFNLTAMAEWSWNAKGRSPEEFAEAYAVSRGVKNPKLFAKWAMKAGEASWDLAETRFFLRMLYDPAMGFYGSQPFDHRFDKSEIVKPESLNKSITTAKEAVKLAKQAGNPDMIDESEFTLAGIQAFGLMMNISKILNGGNLDKATKQKLASYLDELDRVAGIITTRLLSWSDRQNSRKTDRRYAFTQVRLLETANSMLLTTEILRKLTVRLGLKDPRPETRLTDVGEWTAKDFSRNYANLTFDITGKVSVKGGNYYVVFDYLDGPFLVFVSRIQIEKIAPGAKKGKIIATCPDLPGRLKIDRNTKNLECRVKIPPVAKNDKLLLKIKLRMFAQGRKFPEDFPPKKQITWGLVSLRRIYTQEEFPDTPTIIVNPKEKNTSSSSANSTGIKANLRIGILEGMGAESLKKVLEKNKYKVLLIPRLNKSLLEKCGVLIITQKSQPLLLNRKSAMITDWLMSGGGVLCLHDAVGFRKHMAMFRDVGSGNGKVRLPRLKSVASTPITAGLDAKDKFTPDFQYDCISLKTGPNGKIAVTDTKNIPVVVYGKLGRGRVVLNGMLTGIRGGASNLSGDSELPEGAELKVLLNSIKWLNEK